MKATFTLTGSYFEEDPLSFESLEPVLCAFEPQAPSIRPAPQAPTAPAALRNDRRVSPSASILFMDGSFPLLRTAFRSIVRGRTPADTMTAIS